MRVANNCSVDTMLIRDLIAFRYLQLMAKNSATMKTIGDRLHFIECSVNIFHSD